MTDRPCVVTSRLAPSFLPVTAVLELTWRCNLRCRFCSCPWEAPESGFAKGPEMDGEAWRSCLSKLAGMGVTQFAFTGGEPLLRPELIELLDYAAGLEAEWIDDGEDGLRSRRAPPKLYLLSNGQRMTTEVLDACRRLSIHLSLSLPGLETYSYHTGARSPGTVLGWFREARRRGVSTTVGITVTKKNLGELYAAIAEAFLAGADELLLNRFLPGGRGLAHVEELMLSPGEIVEMLDTAEDALEASGRAGHVGTELPLCLIDPSRYRKLRVGTECSAARGFFVVGPDGYVRVCNHSPVRLEHVTAIDALKQNPYWKRFALREYRPSACRACAARLRCDGGCREAAHIVGGAVDSLDPVFTGTAPTPQ